MFSNKNTSELPVGEGLFRKQGSTVKNWKVRQYALFSSSSELQYSDAQTGAVKGSMSVGNVSIREGAKENCKASGAPKEGYSMDICSFNDSRNLEVVFDSGAEARRFLKLLAKVAKKHNLSSFCASQGWSDVTVNLTGPGTGTGTAGAGAGTAGAGAEAGARPLPQPGGASPASSGAGDNAAPLRSPQQEQGQKQEQRDRGDTVGSARSDDSLASPSSSSSAQAAGRQWVEDSQGFICTGTFCKLGSRTVGKKSWKVRRYGIRRDGSLLYYDPSTGALKDSVAVRFIELYVGKKSNIEESSALSAEDAFALDLHLIAGNRLLSLVFDSVSQAKRFVRSLFAVAESHNIPDFATLCGWPGLLTDPDNGQDQKQRPGEREGEDAPSAAGQKQGSYTAEAVVDSIGMFDKEREIRQPDSPVVLHPSARSKGGSVAKGAAGEEGGTRPLPHLLEAGSTRKLDAGKTLFNWKQRSFGIYSDGGMRFYPSSVPSVTAPTEDKAEMQLDLVMLVAGSADNVDASGCADFSQENGIPIEVLLFDSEEDFDNCCSGVSVAAKTSRGPAVHQTPQNLASKRLELVFDSAEDAKIFLEGITKGSLRHNVGQYATKVLNWPVAGGGRSKAQVPGSGDRSSSLTGNVEAREEGSSSSSPDKPPAGTAPEGADAAANLKSADSDAPSWTDNGAAAESAASASAAGDDVGSPSSTSMAGMAASAVSFVVNKTPVAKGVETVRVVGEGLFRKQGSNVKNWKVRKYVITSDHILWYYDSTDALKGNMTVKNIRVGEGNIDAIAASGIKGSIQSHAVSLAVKSLTDNRVLDVVLETETQCKNFLKQLYDASLHNNIPAYFSKTGWDAKHFSAASRGGDSGSGSGGSARRSSLPSAAGEQQWQPAPGSRFAAQSPAATGKGAGAGKGDSEGGPATAGKEGAAGSAAPANPPLIPPDLIQKNLTVQNVQIVGSNAVTVFFVMLQKLVSLQRSTWVVSAVWAAALVYTWYRLSLTRLIIFLLYNYGIYIIILSAPDGSVEPASASGADSAAGGASAASERSSVADSALRRRGSDVTAVTSPSPVGRARSNTGARVEKARNWNESHKKTQ